MKTRSILITIVLVLICKAGYAQSNSSELKMSDTEVNNFLSATNSSNPQALTTINTSLAVGEIPISSSVSPSGAKCYHVPIDIVPGRQGFQPNISLNYNSQAGNGLMGIGWNISGLSVIERVNKNNFFDGKNATPNISIDDAFALDGNRLIEKSRTTTEIEYETATGNIKAIAVLGERFAGTPPILTNYIRYFVVYYPNGNKGFFGFDGDWSQLVDPTKTTITPLFELSFPMTKITNSNGCEILFYYNKDYKYINQISDNNRTYLIDQISYTYCYDKVNFASIKFTYEDRPDQIFALQGSKSNIYRKRLKSIENFVTNNSIPIKKYEITYTNTDPRNTSFTNDVSRLTEINCSANSKNLNPLKFYYGDNNTISPGITATSLVNSNFDFKKIKTLRGKFNQDSENESLVVFYKDTVSTPIKIYKDINNQVSIPDTIHKDGTTIDVLTGNFNGVGKDEICKIDFGSNITDSNGMMVFNLLYLNFYNVNSGGTQFMKQEQITVGGATITVEVGGIGSFKFNHVTERNCLTGDFTGEGKSEILICPVYKPVEYGNLTIDPNTYLVRFGENGETLPLITKENLFLNQPNNEKIFALDIDGDNQTEIVHVRTDKTLLYKYKKGIGITNIGEWSNLKVSDFEKHQVLFGDLNGDSKCDIVISPNAAWRYEVTYTYPDVPLLYSFKCSNCGALHSTEMRNCPCFCDNCNKSLSSGSSYQLPGIKYPTDKGYRTCVKCGTKVNDYYATVCPNCHTARLSTYTYNFYGPYSYDNNWRYMFTDGINPPLTFTKTFVNWRENEQFSLLDVDGDNIPELVSNKGGYITLYPYRDDIHAFGNAYYSFNSYSGSNSTVEDMDISKTIETDNNSENKFSQFIILEKNYISKIDLSLNKQKSNTVSLMINSLGIADKTDFHPLYSGTNYTIGNQAQFPYSDFSGPIWVATQNKVMADKQIVNNNTYSYEGAILHKQGLGFCGFSKTSVTDVIRSKTAITEYDPYKLGAVTHVQTDASEGTYQYYFTVAANKKMTLLPTSKTESNLLTGNTAVTTYSGFDAYGNCGQEVMDLGNGLKTTTTATYDNITTDIYLLGLPKTKTVKNERDGKSITTAQEFEFYSDYKLHFDRKYVYDNSGKTLLNTTEYSYFPNYGTLKDQTETNNINGISLKTSYTYWDTDQSSLKTKTDPFGRITTYNYDFSKSLLINEVDYLGNTTTYDYDDFRRLNNVTKADGTITTIALEWNTDNDLRRVVKQTTLSTGNPVSTKYVDLFGRETRTSVVGFDGTMIYSDKEYDNLGRIMHSSAPYSTTPLWTENTYDEFDRLKTITAPGGSTTSYTYAGNTITENTNGIETAKTIDATGKLISSTDASGTIVYTYRPDGQPDITNASGVETKFGYDNYGRQTSITDPSAGTISTIYDDANRKATQQYGSGKQIITTYNSLGQAISKVTPDFTTTYEYDAGILKSVSSTNGTSRSIELDGLGRLWKTHETVQGKQYDETYEYQNGKLTTITYNPLNYSVAYKYNSIGYLYRLEDISGNKLREITSVNTLGQETAISLGNGVTTAIAYTPEGLLTDVKTTNTANEVLRDMAYSFDPVTGMLNSRTDNKYLQSESFGYGSQYRLEGYGAAANRQSVSYSLNGNIESKTDAGVYNYGLSGKPYNLSYLNLNTASNQYIPLDITYTVNSRPTSITDGISTSLFEYNDNYDRISERISQGGADLIYKNYFAGGKYEVETVRNVEKKRLYIDGSPYTASVVLEQTGSNTPQLYYLHRDYLGSITQISNNSGNLAAEYSYDAWGRLRNPANSQTYSSDAQPALLFGRGYTGHEHLNTFGIINMNARLYDPVLGRFLAPDPVVTDPSSLLDFNRYMYARNNPMIYVDLNGESWKSFWKDFAAAWKRDWGRFISGFDGATIGFNSSGQLSVTPNYYGKPLGPSGGIDFKNNQLTYGNYQNGFFNMQSVSFNGELQKAVTIAELNAYKEYWSNITNWTVKVDIAKEMTLDWIKGSGNVVRTIDNDRVTDELKDAPGVNKARDFFYNKYKEVENLKGASVTNYSSGFFGPKGAYDAGLNPIRQFIGGYSVNINSDGEYLYFSVYNRTSFKSLLFDIGPQWERTSFGPMGNMYQYYKWTEQVEKYRYKIK